LIYAAVDIWSAGVIFLSILTGRYPFFKATDDNMAMMQMISLFGMDNIRKVALKHGESLICSHEKKQLDLKETCKMLRKNAIKGSLSSKSRHSIENESLTNTNNQKKLVEEFPDSAYDLLKKLLELDCDKRISADNLLKHSFFTSI
jgi:cell division control protein 7